MRVAIAQDAPRFLDREATTARALDYVARAGEAGARLLAFGETWLPGYPFWLSSTGGARFDDPAQKRAYAAYLSAAVDVDGPELAAIRDASARHGVAIALGIVERDARGSGGSVWASAVFIHPERGVAPPHRKLRPTYEERLVWAPGDGHGLRVHELDGVRVSLLNCWENWMPQARHALYAQGTQLHVALWPGSRRNTEDITRFVAREGRVFCVSASGVLAREDVPDGFPLASRLDDAVYMDGGSAIAGPDGRWRLPPEVGARTLLIAELELDDVARERQSFDPTGHYARPDVFRVEVDRRRLAASRFRDE
ncbi:MAG: carbon-nitrogen hydrolase family protein [Myxococcales bacterium]|nr:carbon-nitrogen hydrolase family protein [Myxococcales bacterium]